MRLFLRYLKRDILLALKSFIGVGDTQSWKRFHDEVRSKGCNLLKELERYPDAVLVTGCQRSGTTILARLIAQSEGMVNYRARHDDELDAALILSGYEHHTPRGRYCFQTTYLNECYREYFNSRYDFRLIWVIRNPFSVIYSMKYNWERFALNELFDACGHKLLNNYERLRYLQSGRSAISLIKRACLAYNAKELQAIELMERLGAEKMAVVDYDDMVRNTEAILPKIYAFIDAPYKREFSEKIIKESLRKSDLLPQNDRNFIEELSDPIYKKVKTFSTDNGMLITDRGETASEAIPNHAS